MKKNVLRLSVLLAAIVLAGCGGSSDSGSSGTSTALTPADLNTNQTDAMNIRASYTGKNFVTDGIGIATVASLVDGDTTNFYVGTAGVDLKKITIRYNAIDTPESTGRIEAWGVKASNFVKSKLSTAYRIVLDNERDIYDTMDSNNRYLGFVWYQATESSKLRMLNLELVELGYTRNYMYEPTSAYFQYFEKAGEHAEACGAKVYGEIDEGFDPGVTLYSINIAELRKNYSEYGTDDEGETSGKMLIIQALVVGMIGDNMVLRDTEPDENGDYAGIYAFAAYGSTLATYVKVGYIVKFYCSAGKFNGNMQLSNINVKTTGNRKFEIIAKNITGPTDEFEEINVDPVAIDNTTASKTLLSNHVGHFIVTTVTIRNVEIGDYDQDGNIISGTEQTAYFKKDAKNNMTIYARLNNSVVFNLRVDGTSSPYASETLFEVGSSYIVKGYLAPYFDNYQLQLFNNNIAFGYITKVV